MDATTAAAGAVPPAVAATASWSASGGPYGGGGRGGSGGGAATEGGGAKAVGGTSGGVVGGGGVQRAHRASAGFDVQSGEGESFTMSDLESSLAAEEVLSGAAVCKVGLVWLSLSGNGHRAFQEYTVLGWVMCVAVCVVSVCVA